MATDIGQRLLAVPKGAKWDKSDVSTPSCKGLVHPEADVANIDRFPLPDEQFWLSAERQIRDVPRYRDPSKVALTAVD